MWRACSVAFTSLTINNINPDRPGSTFSGSAPGKLIKSNLMVANCLVFHTVYLLTRQIRELKRTGKLALEEMLRHLNPCWMGLLNRFGRYDWEVKRMPDPVMLDHKG